MSNTANCTVRATLKYFLHIFPLLYANTTAGIAKILRKRLTIPKICGIIYVIQTTDTKRNDKNGNAF